MPMLHKLLLLRPSRHDACLASSCLIHTCTCSECIPPPVAKKKKKVDKYTGTENKAIIVSSARKLCPCCRAYIRNSRRRSRLYVDEEALAAAGRSIGCHVSSRSTTRPCRQPPAASRQRPLLPPHLQPALAPRQLCHPRPRPGYGHDAPWTTVDLPIVLCTPTPWPQSQTSSGQCPRRSRPCWPRCAPRTWSTTQRLSCLQVRAARHTESPRLTLVCRAHQCHSRLPARRRHVQLCAHLETHARDGLR